MVRLCFDYGHGGEDSGACYNGIKDNVKVIADMIDHFERHPPGNEHIKP